MAISEIRGQHLVSFKGQVSQANQTNKRNEKVVTNDAKSDSVEIKKHVKPPEISTMRLLFGVLSDEQIEQLNKSRKMPANGKFVRDGYGGYAVSCNLMDFRVGTRKLPAGFEVRKNILGFACVLPKDSEGLFIEHKESDADKVDDDDDDDVKDSKSEDSDDSD